MKLWFHGVTVSLLEQKTCPLTARSDAETADDFSVNGVTASNVALGSLESATQIQAIVVVVVLIKRASLSVVAA